MSLRCGCHYPLLALMGSDMKVVYKSHQMRETMILSRIARKLFTQTCEDTVIILQLSETRWGSLDNKAIIGLDEATKWIIYTSLLVMTWKIISSCYVCPVMTSCSGHRESKPVSSITYWSFHAYQHIHIALIRT